MKSGFADVAGVILNELPSWMLILMVPKQVLFNTWLGINLVQTHQQTLILVISDY